MNINIKKRKENPKMKKNYLKMFAIVLCFVSIITVFAACKKEDKNTTQEKDKTNDQKEITEKPENTKENIPEKKNLKNLKEYQLGILRRWR